jgi:hypothetical protein
VQEKFAEKFPETPILHCNAVHRLMEKFRETGSVLDGEQSGRPSELNDEKLLDISDYAAESIKIIAQVGTRGRFQACNSAKAWVAISRRCIVGPLFFEETVNSERYCSMLYSFISLLEEDEITYSLFQQDGATVHTANNAMKLLNEIFGEHVISTNLRPPHSPDLTPPDFYLWGAAKSAVYRDRPRMLNDLKTAITAYIRNISQADLQKVFVNKIKWVQACIKARGHHFQHLL